MAKTKGTEIALAPDEKALAELRQEFPAEVGFSQIMLPRISMTSQDVSEGKGKAKTVVTEAGTFFLEQQTDAVDENGKKKWQKDEIGTEIEGIILFRRKQLRYFDEKSETYTSSPAYDEDTEIVPLFCNKSEVARGTPKDLQARSEYQITKDGKTTSKLEENRILYVLYKDEVYQLNLRGSSMYSFMSYSRSVLVPSVLTRFSSEAMEKGQIAWNKMTFEVVRQLNADETNNILERVRKIKADIGEMKAHFSKQVATNDVATGPNKAFDAIEGKN